MTLTAGLIFGFVLALAYGALFHLLFNGSAERLLAYLFLALFGFWVGHLLGRWLNLTAFQLGSLYLLSASIGSWVMLFAGRWLMGKNQ